MVNIEILTCVPSPSFANAKRKDALRLCDRRDLAAFKTIDVVRVRSYAIGSYAFE